MSNIFDILSIAYLARNVKYFLHSKSLIPSLAMERDKKALPELRERSFACFFL